MPPDSKRALHTYLRNRNPNMNNTSLMIPGAHAMDNLRLLQHRQQQCVRQRLAISVGRQARPGEPAMYRQQHPGGMPGQNFPGQEFREYCSMQSWKGVTGGGGGGHQWGEVLSA